MKDEKEERGTEWEGGKWSTEIVHKFARCKVSGDGEGCVPRPINFKAYCDGMTSLLLAHKEGHWEIFKMLIAHGTDVNVKDLKGDTKLHQACSNGQWLVEIARVLIENGADLHVQDDKLAQ